MPRGWDNVLQIDNVLQMDSGTPERGNVLQAQTEALGQRISTSAGLFGDLSSGFQFFRVFQEERHQPKPVPQGPQRRTNH